MAKNNPLTYIKRFLRTFEGFREIHDCDSTNSQYFAVGEVKFRLSDHVKTTMSEQWKNDISITMPVNQDNIYIIHIAKNLGTLIMNLAQTKEFIRNYILLNSMQKFSYSSSTKKEAKTTTDEDPKPVVVGRKHLIETPPEPKDKSKKYKEIPFDDIVNKFKKAKNINILEGQELGILLKGSVKWYSTTKYKLSEGFKKELKKHLKDNDVNYEQFTDIMNTITIAFNKKRPANMDRKWLADILGLSTK